MSLPASSSEIFPSKSSIVVFLANVSEITLSEKEIESPKNSKKERKLSNKKAFTKNSLSNVDNIDDLFKDFETQKNGDKAAVTPTSIHEKVMSGETRKKKRNRQKRERERKKKHLQEEQKKEAEEKENESEEEEESVISETLARKTTMEDFEGNICYSSLITIFLCLKIFEQIINIIDIRQ
jgi:hypothetical protein